MMYAFSTLVVLLTLQHAQCSLVMEASSQKGIYVSEYCPKMKYCAEGTHVMCMYYTPGRVMGPRCTKPKNVSVTPQLADTLLEITNAIRSKVALGKEKGKGGESFPRGYGIFRLQWDNELATFAQVLANQCVLRHDMCRATHRFQDPGQAASLVRFTYPEWIPIARNTGLNKPGLTKQKLEYAIKVAIKSWYNQKSVVSPPMIINSPDWTQNPGNQYGRLYLEMIYGPATHMGCGMSAYTEYVYYDNNADLNYNSIQIICNYSARTRKGNPVYEVSPPTKVGYTIKCGCPEGMDEDSDCLCFKSTRNAIQPLAGNTGESCAGEQSCKPAVVLLPIFTVENAPPEKLALRNYLRTNVNEKKDSEMEIMDYQPPENHTIFHAIASAHRGPNSVLNNLINEVHHRGEYTLSSTSRSHIYDVKNRFFDHKPAKTMQHNIKATVHAMPNHVFSQHKKESVFLRAPTFELNRKNEITTKPTHEVLPRKDFSKAKSLVKSYMDLRRHRVKAQKEESKTSSEFLKFLREHTRTTTEPYSQLQSSAEEKVISYHSLLTNKIEQKPSKTLKEIFGDIDTDSSNEKSKDKLMNLLDKLEQEVKHIELDKNKKEIFDARLRKIYGTVVGKHAESEITDLETDLDIGNHKPDHHSYLDWEKNKNLKKNAISENYDLDRIREQIKQNNMHNEMRPITRSQNEISNRIQDKPIDHRSKDLDIGLKHLYSDNDNMKTKYTHNLFGEANEFNIRNTYNEKESKLNHIYSETEEKKKLIDAEKRNHVTLNEHEEDPLDIERRRFYQDKLDNIVRKVHTRTYKHNAEPINHPLIRPVIRPSRDDNSLRMAKTQANPFYMPDRARFLHGF